MQDKQLGTGHAAAAAAEALKDFDGELMIAYGDMPLMTASTFEASFAARGEGLAIVAFRAADPGAYGRVLLDASGALDRIVEFKDASEAERKTDLCNAGVLAVDAKKFFALGRQASTTRMRRANSISPIFPRWPSAMGRAVRWRRWPKKTRWASTAAPNWRKPSAACRRHCRAKALAAGVGMISAGDGVSLHDTVLDADVEHRTVRRLEARRQRGVRRADLKATADLEGASIAAGAVIGPYAPASRQRALAKARISGNFVEVKNTAIDKGAKANHLTYLGDAHIGAGANIGAGVITCGL